MNITMMSGSSKETDVILIMFFKTRGALACPSVGPSPHHAHRSLANHQKNVGQPAFVIQGHLLDPERNNQKTRDGGSVRLELSSDFQHNTSTASHLVLSLSRL
jgi:hypothetical protein